MRYLSRNNRTFHDINKGKGFASLLASFSVDHDAGPTECRDGDVENI